MVVGSTRMTVLNGMYSSRSTLDAFLTGSAVRGAAHRLGVDEMKRRGEALVVTRLGEAVTATAHLVQLGLAFVSATERASKPRRFASMLPSYLCTGEMMKRGEAVASCCLSTRTFG